MLENLTDKKVKIILGTSSGISVDGRSVGSAIIIVQGTYVGAHHNKFLEIKNSTMEYIKTSTLNLSGSAKPIIEESKTVFLNVDKIISISVIE